MPHSVLFKLNIKWGSRKLQPNKVELPTSGSSVAADPSHIFVETETLACGRARKQLLSGVLIIAGASQGPTGLDFFDIER